MITALLLLAVSASAAVAPAPAAPAAHVKPYWLKTYVFAPYRESWRGELSVKGLDASLPKVAEAVEKSGGRLTQPLSSFVRSVSEQQLTLTVPQKKAKALLQALRKLGKLPDPAVRQGGAPIPLDEVREKLARLTKDKMDNGAALAKVPAASEAVDEMIEHLANIEAVGRSSEGEVLWNLTVKEAR